MPASASSSLFKPASQSRKRGQRERPAKRQRLFQLTILDLTASSPALKAWPVPARSRTRASVKARTPYRNGRTQTGRQHTKGD
ncbi:hypothetical protein FLX56_10675 [Synechococcus moorigangaii CMS01]|nr:hypothetical protein [Synechococcus moorigangaii CMS01]